MTLAKVEREKYARVWSFKDYHANSPGERLAPYFLKHVAWEKGDTLIDLGCGTARASRYFVRAGLNVFLLDHVNAVDPAIDLPFIESNLWDLAVLVKFDWFYCCDVLEHIPPEKIDLVLDNILGITGKGGFFQIALFPDEWHGEILHLTLESSEWWLEQIKKRWKIKSVESPEKRRIVVVVER